MRRGRGLLAKEGLGPGVAQAGAAGHVAVGGGGAQRARGGVGTEREAEAGQDLEQRVGKVGGST